ncbi:hypothetical protein Tco_1378415 [Tanacetum coccineum]
MESIRIKFFNGVALRIERFRGLSSIYGSKFDLQVTDQPSIWCSILREVKNLLKDSGFGFFLRIFPRFVALELDKEIWWLIKMGKSLLRSQTAFRRTSCCGAERNASEGDLEL